MVRFGYPRVVGCVLAVGCVGGDFAFEGARADGLSTVVYVKHEGLEVCSIEPEPVRVEIVRVGDGYEIKGLYSLPGPYTPTGECVAPEGGCTHVVGFGPSPLAPPKVHQLEVALEAVPARHCAEFKADCDYCYTDQIVVNGESATGNCCGKLNEDFAHRFAAAVELLRALGEEAYATQNP